jgi:hypothetical protein
MGPPGWIQTHIGWGVCVGLEEDEEEAVAVTGADVYAATLDMGLTPM